MKPDSMLRTRLFLSLLPFVVVLLAMGVYAIAVFSHLAHGIDATVTENDPSIRAVQTNMQSLAEMERAVWNSTVTGNLDNKSLAGNQKQFEDNLALLQRGTLRGEKELNDQLATNYQAFRKSIAALTSLRTPKDQQQAYDEAIVSRVSKMNGLLEQIRKLNFDAVLATSRDVQKKTQNLTRLIVAGMVFMLVVAAFTSYQLSRSILQPIQMLTRATREVGEGNLNQPVPVSSRDELGELALAFNKMAAQLEEYRHSATEEIVRLHRTMETTLASFPDPIFVLNKDGRIELKNPAANALMSSLGLNGQLPDRLQAIAEESLESGDNFLPHSFNEVVSYRVNGADKFFLPRILVMRNKENALSGVAVVLYDVTRFQLLDAAKTNLVATVSHELKTPLTSVRMVLHILLEKTVGALTTKQDELLRTARDDTERLLRILNDLLDLARLEEGNAELRKEKVAPVELVRSVMDEVADKISANGLKMNCLIEPHLPAVLVDRQRIRHVFTNLITNAIKHSPPGGKILLQAALAEDDNVQFSVRDHGPGIAEEYHARIFDRFFRVPGQDKSGAGLGLSIAREITVAHGGRIGVKSSPGEGSIFFVVLKASE